jgi:hypothetical protein
MGYLTAEARRRLAKALKRVLPDARDHHIWDVVDAVYELIDQAPSSQRQGAVAPERERWSSL